MSLSASRSHEPTTVYVKTPNCVETPRITNDARRSLDHIQSHMVPKFQDQDPEDVAGLMFSQDARVRVAAIQAMPKFGKRGAGFADEVVMCMSESSPEIRIAALRALQEFPTASEYKYEVENVLDLESFPEIKLVAKSVLASITLGAVHGLDLEDME